MFPFCSRVFVFLRALGVLAVYCMLAISCARQQTLLLPSLPAGYREGVGVVRPSQMATLSPSTRVLKYGLRSPPVVSRSTSQPRVSSSRCRSPKKRFAGARSGSLNSTSKSTSLDSVDLPRAVDPNASSCITSNSLHAGKTAFLISSSVILIADYFPPVTPSLDRRSCVTGASPVNAMVRFLLGLLTGWPSL